MARPKTYPTKTPGIRKDDKGRFWVYAKIDGRPIWKLIGKKKAEAVRWLEDKRREARQAQLFPGTAKRPRHLTLKDLFTRYRSEDQNQNRTSDRNAAYERRWIEAVGNIKADAMSVSLVTDQQNSWLKSGLAPGTINRFCARIRRVYAQAVRDGLFPFNPLEGMPKLAEPPGRFRVLSYEEEHQLRELMKPWAFRFVEFALLSGCRQGEQFAMKAGQVDMEAGALRILRSKSNKGRVIPMSQRLRAVVAAQLERRSVWLFPNFSDSNHWKANNFIRRHFKPALQAAGIEDLTWHDLRRTCGSRLAERGARTRSIQLLLGHSNIRTTERYMQLSEDHLSEIIHLQDL